MKTWDEMEPRVRDAWVHVEVFGTPQPTCTRKLNWGAFCPAHHKHDCCGRLICPRYTTDASSDYEILKRVREEKWIYEKEGQYNEFWNSLAEILRSRDPYYRDTVNQNELHYMLEYRPGDYSHAAYLALTGVAQCKTNF